MSASEHKSLPSIGFLTVVDLSEVGLLGGFLAVNPAGRPLEFHCTTPVRATRAQEILYGNALEPFLCGELIGQALLDKATSKPNLVLTDQMPLLSVREFCQTPVVCVSDKQEKPELKTFRLDGAHGVAPSKVFALGQYQASLPTDYAGDLEAVNRVWGSFSGLDVFEPFQRIREAIQETQA